MTARGVAAMLAASVVLLAAACGGGSSPAEPTPTGAPLLSASADMHIYRSVEEFAKASELVALVTPLRREADWWDERGLHVASRFVLRVDRVFAGEVAPGTEIVAMVPGGLTAETFPVHGPRLPRPGEPIFDEVYADFPRYEIGHQEVVFLVRNPGAGLDAYGQLGPIGRFTVANGQLSALPQGIESIDPFGVTGQLETARLDDLAQFVAAARARPDPEPTLPAALQADD